jgi:hypothetical protein
MPRSGEAAFLDLFFEYHGLAMERTGAAKRSLCGFASELRHGSGRTRVTHRGKRRIPPLSWKSAEIAAESSMIEQMSDADLNGTIIVRSMTGKTRRCEKRKAGGIYDMALSIHFTVHSSMSWPTDEAINRLHVSPAASRSVNRLPRSMDRLPL